MSASLLLVLLAVISNFFLIPSGKADGPDQAVGLFGYLDGNYQKDFNYDGSGPTYPGGPNVASIATPTQTAIDTVNHRLFAADRGWARVLVYQLDNNDELQSYKADWIIGQPDFASFGSSPSQSSMSAADGVAYDSDRQLLFVSDSFDLRVLVFDLSGGITDGMDASYVLGQVDFTSNDFDTTQSSVGEPYHMAFENDTDNLYVVDGSNYRVMVFDTTTLSNNMNASSVLGQDDFVTSGDCDLELDELCIPVGASYDQTNDRLFIGEEGWGRVLVWDLSGGITNGMDASWVLGQESGTTWDGSADRDTMDMVDGVGYDPDHNYLYAADVGFNRTMVFDVASITNGEDALNVLGQPDFDSAACPGAPNQHSVCVSWGASYNQGSNQIVVSDTIDNRIMFFDADNISDNMNAEDALGQNNGSRMVDYTTDGDDNNGFYASSNFSPDDVLIDGTNHRFFASLGDRIMVYDLDVNNNMTDDNANYVLGVSKFSDPYSGGNPTQNTFSAVSGMAVDETNELLFVSEHGTSPGCGRVVVFDLSGGITDGMNASYVLGQENFTDEVCATDQDSLSNTVFDVTYDQANDRLFVADHDTHSRVMVWDLGGGITNGMDASWVLGNEDFTTSGFEPADQDSLNGPFSVSYDNNANRLFVQDSQNSRTMIWDLGGGITNGMDASWVLGQPDFITTDYCFTPDDTCVPYSYGLEYDESTDTLFVADNDYYRVMAYDFSAGITNGMAAADVIGQPDFVTGDPGTDDESLAAANRITYDPGNDLLYTTDYSNGRVMVFSYTDSIAGSGDTTPPSVPTGVTVTDTGTTTITLSWSPSTDNVGVSGYHVFRDGIQVGSPSGTTFTDTGLSPGTTYSYRVSAFDAASNESAQSSPAVNGTTDSAGGGLQGGDGDDTQGGDGGGLQGGGLPDGGSDDSGSDDDGTINLEQQPGFTNGQGYSDSSGPGQTYTFTTGSGDNTVVHTVTVTNLDGGRAELNIDNTHVIVLGPGETSSQDVDGDGQDDISIGLVNLTSSSADLRFFKLTSTSFGDGPGNNGFGAGSGSSTDGSGGGGGIGELIRRLARPIPDSFLLGFPWLLFVLMALTSGRLYWLARQEKRAAAALRAAITREKRLIEEKTNFITLVSHYLRTPLTAITGGVELLAGLGIATSAATAATSLSKQLASKVNSLVNELSSRSGLPAGQVTDSGIQLAGGHASSIYKSWAFRLPVFGSLGAIAIADFLYVYDRGYNVWLVAILIQLVAMLLACVLLYSGIRSSKNHKLLKSEAAHQLNEQRALDSARSEAIRRSLAEVGQPLDELKRQLSQVQAAASNAKAVKPAMGGVERLQATLDNFLKVTALETASVASVPEPVSLKSVVAELVHQHQKALLDKNISLKTDLSVEVVRQNPALLSLALSAVVDNAIKYSPEHQEVAISAKSEGKNTVLSVTDHGPGIAGDKLQQLFKPFSRVEQAAADFNKEGIGLGLYMAKLVTSYLGGQIAAESVPAHGMTVTLTLPGQPEAGLIPPKEIAPTSGKLPELFRPVTTTTPSGGTQPLLRA